MCAVLFWGEHPEAEVVHRNGLPEDVCRALTTSGGRQVADEVRRSGEPIRITKDSLPIEARELRASLGDHGLSSIAVFPLIGEAGVIGSLVLPFEEHLPPLDECDTTWRLACRTIVGLQLAAINSALRVTLDQDRLLPAEPIDGVLVLDRWERVILADGLFRTLPGWSRADPFGRSLDSLPGVKILSSHPVCEGGSLSWAEHLLPPIEGHGVPVALASIPFRITDSVEESGRVILLRDLRADDDCTGDGAGRMLALGMRVAHAGDTLAAVISPQEGCEPGTGIDPSIVEQFETEVLEGRRLVGEVLDRCCAPEDRQTAQLNDLIGEILNRYEEELEFERVRIFSFLRQDLPRVSGDPLQILRALRVLVQLAGESLRPGGGSLTARSWSEDGWVYAAISDDGVGRLGHDEERIGDPLFAVPTELQEKRLGGVRSIAARAGGKLIVESRPRVWTRNTLMLREERRRRPRTLEGEMAGPVRSMGTTAGGLSVLVVDDNAALRSVLRRYLERRGHTVAEAVDGEDGLRVLKDREFDRVVVDIHMPRKDGPGFYEGLTGVAPIMRERTIFMTGGLLEEHTERFVWDSGRPWIRKPFDLAEMAKTVESGAKVE